MWASMRVLQVVGLQGGKSRFRRAFVVAGDTLAVMAEDQAGVQNQTSGEVRGSVVQAGTIHQFWLGEARSDAIGRPLVPRQLPPAVRDFTGRAEHVAALDALLSTGHDETSWPRTAVITAIDGTGGIGKTTLAVWWAHRTQHQFPDGTLHVNLRGYGPGDPATTTDVLDGFLRTFGVSPDRMPVGVEAQAGLFRSLLAERRVLIVLDNAHHADQVRPLLPGTPGCLVLITSRDSMTGLVVTDGAARLTLDLLTEPEAVQLVTGVIGPARATAEAAAVLELVRRCSRLPLALRIAAARATAYPHATVADVVAELTDEHARLEVLSRGEDQHAAVLAVFDWSYQRLSDDQARVFRLLGLHPGPEVGVAATAAAADIDLPTASRVLEELAQVHMIEPVSKGRYRFHDLLRAYALDQATHTDSPVERDHVQLSLLDWYAHTGRACDALAYPAYPRLRQLAPVPSRPTPIPDQTTALAWLAKERDNLLAAMHDAARHGRHHHILHLVASLRTLIASGSWDAALDAVSRAIDAARCCEDHRAEILFRLWHGDSLIFLRRWDDARADFDQALALARTLDDRGLLAEALNSLGWLSIEQGRFEQAFRYLEEALPLSRGADTGRTEGLVECNLSQAYATLGRYQQALHHAENELSLRRRCGDVEGEAMALHDLGRAWQGLGQHRKAIELCRKAISVGRTTSFLYQTVAEPLDTLAVSLHHTGDTASAMVCWEEAVAIFDDCGRPFEADQVRERARGASIPPQT